MHLKSSLTTLATVAALAQLSACGGSEAAAQTPSFTLISPDLASGSFTNQFIANGFGCTGDNVSPALEWRNAPAGTRSFALTMYDPDAPTGSGFWHWAVYNIPGNVSGLVQGAGNASAKLPIPAFGGSNDFQDTGVNGVNGNYGGPCPPAGDSSHRYIFTIYALAVEDVATAGGVPKTGTAALYGFLLNKGLSNQVLGKASFTATYAR